MDLNTIWFWLIGVLIIGYAILDGFDFGVGILSLFSRFENERRIHFNAIGPVWDGNEVWLLTGGGALFAAFPAVYAMVFSGFYIALMLLLAALIFRAVSFEFRNKVDSPAWRRLWDWAFGLGSLLPALLFGVVIGNILHGVPIDTNGNYLGTFIGLLNPYSLGVGFLSLVLFTMHGAIYLATKSDGILRDRCQKCRYHSMDVARISIPLQGCTRQFIVLYFYHCLVRVYCVPAHNVKGRKIQPRFPCFVLDHYGYAGSNGTQPLSAACTVIDRPSI